MPGEKYYSIVITEKNDYIKKMQQMRGKGIQYGVYAKTKYNTVKAFSEFLV